MKNTELTKTQLKFSGIERLIGQDSAKILQTKKIAIIGLGGVGSWVAEALVRSGISYLRIVDYDEVCISNFNRQLHGLEKNIGKSKVQALKSRFLEIHPHLEIDCMEDFYSEKNSSMILQDMDLVIDAIDDFSAKCHLVVTCKKQKLPLIVIGAAGGKKDPTKIRIDDLSKSKNDALLQRLRKTLRQKYQFPRGKNKFQIPCVYSEELSSLQEDCEKPRGSLDCNIGYGTATYITGSFGFFAAHLAVELLTGKRQ